MNREYEAYLNSEEWKERRKRRLKMTGFRCSACHKKGMIQVHHLTYERIFREEMSDLLPLCKKHHDDAEELIKQKVIPRCGYPAFLQERTLLLLVNPGISEPEVIPKILKKKKKRQKKSRREHRPNGDLKGICRKRLEKSKQFMALIKDTPRSRFLSEIERLFKTEQGWTIAFDEFRPLAMKLFQKHKR